MDKTTKLQDLTKEEQIIFQSLKATLLFENVPIKQLIELSTHCRISHRKKGAVIYRKDEPSNHLYIIKSGYIMESVFYGTSADIIVKVRSDGEYFGEMGMLTNESYPNTALTLEDSLLISIPKNYFLEAVWGHPCVCKVIIQELIDRLLNSAQHMVNAMYLDAPGRLASTIVNLTTNSKQKNMSIRITQSALAFSCGMARQTAAKILSDWRKEGIISTERGKLSVLDFNKLLDIILISEIGD